MTRKGHAKDDAKDQRIGLPGGTRLSMVRSGGRELLILSYPLAPFSTSRKQLPPAEGEVLEALLNGKSNAEIARQRKTSPRTIAVQARSIFRKLGVGSRNELASLWARAR